LLALQKKNSLENRETEGRSNKKKKKNDDKNNVDLKS